MTRYAEIVIRYSRHMPPTSLFFLKQSIERIAESYTPKLSVRIEKVDEEELKRGV